MLGNYLMLLPKIRYCQFALKHTVQLNIFMYAVHFGPLVESLLTFEIWNVLQFKDIQITTVYKRIKNKN